MNAIVTIVCAFLLSGCCCGLDKLGSGSSGSGPASESKGVSSTPAEKPTIVALKTLLSDYKGNEVRADGTYKGKTIEVSGTVDEVKKDIMGEIYVAIGTGAQFEIPQIQCFAKDGQESAFAKLNKGQKITVQGRVDGLMMNVLVRECVVR